MVPVVYENNNWTKIDSKNHDWHNYLNGKWANAVTFNNGLVYNEVENDSNIKYFDGVDDYITLGSEKKDFENNITLMSRFKIYEKGSATQILIGNIETTGFYLGLTSKNKIRIRIVESVLASDGTTTNTDKMITLDQVELNTWYTVVATYDGSMIKLYVNGVLEGSLAYSGAISVSEAPLAIGANPNVDFKGVVSYSAGYFKGCISETAVMTNAISAEEVAQNYGVNPTHNPTKHDVLYYLKFNANNGIVCNSPTRTTEGMSFDGVDDFVCVGYSDYDFNNTFSIGARVKINEYTTKTEYSIFGNPQDGGFNIFKAKDNKFKVAVWDQNTYNQTTQKNGAYINLETTFIPELDTWYTLFATYDGTTLKLYIDGKLEASKEIQMNMLAVTTPFMIGVNGDLDSVPTGHYLNGWVSDAILIDEALTDEQISTYYSDDVTAVISDKTLINYNFRSYEGREDGTIIPEEMINSMWVWIPRFTAKTPTTNDQKIDVEIIEPDKDAHDAFNFSSQSLEGFWVGKFENSANVSYANTDLNINVNSNLLIKPNINSFNNKKISYMFDEINKISTHTDIYGFDGSNHTLLDTHLVKNNEWAAVSYLTQSKYGLCREDVYKELASNDTYITGGSDYKTNVNQSSTHNIYGVYDLSGGTIEFVMGNYNSTLNSSDGFTSLPDSIYFNAYTTSDNYLTNGYQHALFETNDLFNTSPNDFINENYPWIIRDGLFTYSNSKGDALETRGTRTSLTIK